MPSYADDDVVDYENETPSFQDEAEFDDYLNDEEYELINDIFPQAKKELEEYQGWDNLSVKLAIFDSDFDLQGTIAELKRDLKKKKPQQQPPLTTQAPKTAKSMYFIDNFIQLFATD